MLPQSLLPVLPKLKGKATKALRCIVCTMPPCRIFFPMFGFVSRFRHDPISSSSLPIPFRSVHLKVEEKIALEANRDGGLEHMEIRGTMWLIVRLAPSSCEAVCVSSL